MFLASVGKILEIVYHFKAELFLFAIFFQQFFFFVVFGIAVAVTISVASCVIAAVF